MEYTYMLILEITKSTDKKNFTKIGSAFEPWDAEQIIRNDVTAQKQNPNTIAFERKSVKCKDGSYHNVKRTVVDNTEYRIWEYGAKDL